MMLHTCLPLDIDIWIVSKPDKKMTGGEAWLRDLNQEIDVLCINKSTGIMREDTNNSGRIVLEFEKYIMTCCYLPPSLLMDEYVKRVTK